MSNLQRLQRREADLKAELGAIERKIKDERLRLASVISVEKRKASTVLTNTLTGIAIVIGKANFHGERKIHEYTGKKGKLIDNNFRGSLHATKMLFATGGF